MLGIGCSDLGMQCSYVAIGRTAEQAKKLLFDHIMRRHKGDIQGRAEILEKIDKLLECQMHENDGSKRHLPANFVSRDSHKPLQISNKEKKVCNEICIMQCSPYIPLNKSPGSEFNL